MSTRVMFEPGVLADAVKKAARIAPAKGGIEMDKAAGIVFDIDPNGDAKCVVRATDTSTFYMEVIDVVKVEGDAVRWRLASAVMAAILGGLVTRNTNILMETDGKDNRVHIVCGRLDVRVVMNPNLDYPVWSPSDSSQLSSVVNLGESIMRVEWASKKGDIAPFCGVLLDGEYIFATDRYRMARVPMKIPALTQPALITANSLGSIVSNLGTVKVGSDGTLLVVEANDYTQFKTLTLDGSFPAHKYVNFDVDLYEQHIEVSREELVQRITQAASFAGSNRDPVVQFLIGRHQFAVCIENVETGKFSDVIEVPGAANHDWCAIKFAPKFILDCLTHAPTDNVTLSYRPTATGKPCMISGDRGYEVIVAPRQEAKNA